MLERDRSTERGLAVFPLPREGPEDNTLVEHVRVIDLAAEVLDHCQNVKELVRGWIDGVDKSEALVRQSEVSTSDDGVQPFEVAIHSNHRLVDRNLIRGRVGLGL